MNATTWTSNTVDECNNLDDEYMEEEKEWYAVQDEAPKRI